MFQACFLFPIIDESANLNGVAYLNSFNLDFWYILYYFENSPNAIKAGNFGNTLYRIGVGIKHID